MAEGRAIEYSREAVKALRSIDAKASKLIRSKIGQYAADPAALANNVRALKGSSVLRLRVGDYRVLFTETMVVLTVLRVGHRKAIYE